MKLRIENRRQDLYLVAQHWLRHNINTDIVVRCGGKDPSTKAVEFRCHRLMIHDFLGRQLGPWLAHAEEDDLLLLLLPDTEPAAFRRYLDLVYGLHADVASLEGPGFGLEDDSALRRSIEELLRGVLLPAIQIKVEDIEDLTKARKSRTGSDTDKNDEASSDESKFDPEEFRPAAAAQEKSSSSSSSPSKTHGCTFCPKEFARHDHLSRHLTIHSGARPHHCHLCRQGFTRKDKLKHHLCRAHGIVSVATDQAAASLQCSCGLGFEREVDWHEHRAAHPLHERRAADDNAADEEANAVDNAPTLAAAAADDDIGMCDENGGVDVKVEIVENEIKVEPGDFLAIVGDEVVQSNTGKALKTRGVGRTTEKSSKKKRASRPAKKSGSVKRKKKGPTTYLCKYCKEGFPSIGKRKQHILDSHWSELKNKGLLFTHNNALSIKNHVCEYEGCDRIFRHLCELTDHVNVVHKNQKNYVCELCSKAFPYRKSLRYHMDIKHDRGMEGRLTANILCPECGDIFSSKIKLGVHMTCKHRIKVQRFQCKFCDFKTHAKNVIIEHERTHTGEKPEICQWCGKGFNAKKTLRNHERLHTGEKPYKCRHCDTGFAQRTSLNVHMASHHKGQAPVFSPLKERNSWTLPTGSAASSGPAAPVAEQEADQHPDHGKLSTPRETPGEFKPFGISSYEAYLEKMKQYRMQEDEAMNADSDESDA